MDQEPHKARKLVTRIRSLEPPLYVMTIDRQVSNPSRPPCWKADCILRDLRVRAANLANLSRIVAASH